MKILLVDDWKEIAERWADILRSKIGNASVTLCHHGDEALEIFKKQGPFDVVVTDQLHEGLSGVNLVRTVRKRRPKQPCIIYTADPLLPELKKPPCLVVPKSVRNRYCEELVEALIRLAN